MSGSVMWFRRDLRLADNPALVAALAEGPATLCVFAPLAPGPHSPGAAFRQWRAASMRALDERVRKRGGALWVLEGDPAEELVRLARERGADSVHCHRDWTPEAMLEESRVGAALAAAGVRLHAHEGQLLVAPDELLTAAGTPYRVFTPYYRAWLGRIGQEVGLPAPAAIPQEGGWSDEFGVTEASSRGGTAAEPLIGLELGRWWRPGERAAHDDLVAFAEGALADYERDHDLPGIDGTSRLSPRLAHGELSPRQVVETAVGAQPDAAVAFIRQLAWREFAYHVLHHFPSTSDRPLRPEFELFPWNEDEDLFDVWSAGRTGFPFVDAGMRQLVATGWMHNRARLAAGSFLAKDLLVPWQRGDAWFRERLVDYDPALNAFNWQWVAGSGADAAPYFRIFNPLRQADRFDADGAYRRAWVPEMFTEAYPAAVVDHAEARRRALAAFEAMRR